MSEVEINKVNPESFKPAMDKILIQMVRESEFYGSTNLKKAGTEIQVEPYAYVVCTGPQVTSCKPGDTIIVNANGKTMFTLFGTGYALVSQYDIAAVINSEIAEEITKQVASKKVQDKILN